MADEGPPGAWWRRLRWWMVPAALGAVVLGVVAVTTILFITREDPDPMPVEDVLDEFRSSSSTTTTVTSTTAPTSSAPTSSAPTSSAPTSSTAAEVPVEFLPPAGVYVMEGEGREAISLPPVSQDDGETMPATVTHDGDGCWTFTLFYNEAHWQDWELCPNDRGPDIGLVETGGHTFQRWDFGAITVENLSTFVCDPPAPFLVRDAAPGSSWDRSCDGTNTQVDGTTTSAGTLTFVGVETLRIGNNDLEALHFLRDNTLTGAQTGEDENHMWFAAADGLPLRGERQNRVESDSPVGSVSYTESGWWQLTSTDPQR